MRLRAIWNEFGIGVFSWFFNPADDLGLVVLLYALVALVPGLVLAFFCCIFFLGRASKAKNAEAFRTQIVFVLLSVVAACFFIYFYYFIYKAVSEYFRGDKV